MYHFSVDYFGNTAHSIRSAVSDFEVRGFILIAFDRVFGDDNITIVSVGEPERELFGRTIYRVEVWPSNQPLPYTLTVYTEAIQLGEIFA